MPKYRNALVIVLVVLVVILGGAAVYLGLQKAGKLGSSYSVVYLASGEVYVGRLSYFPSMTLTDAYILQLVKEQPATEQSPAKPASFQLAPLSEAVWSPQKLYLNREQVLFYGPISEDSKVAQSLKNKTK